MNRDKHIKMAVDEDCCRQDVTTKLLPIHKKCKAIIKIKETSHVYGIRWLEQVFKQIDKKIKIKFYICLLYTSPSPRDRTRSRMPSSA